MSVVSHDGDTLNSGHYFVDIKDSNGKWKRVNDTRIDEDITNPSILGYIFICER